MTGMRRGSTTDLTTAIAGSFRPSRVEVDLDAVRHNVSTIRTLAGVEVCAVVKADGYGHGAVPVARAALEGGAGWLAVALLEEALTLREAAINAPILLLAEPPVTAIPTLVDAEVTPTAYRASFLAALEGAAQARGRPLDVHFKIDTGMQRDGSPEDEWEDRLAQLAASRWLQVTGIQTHLVRSEDRFDPTTDAQLARLDRFLAAAADLGIEPEYVHSANSAGALLHPAARRSMVRPGICIYGLSPGADVDVTDHGLRPALSLVSEVSMVKRIAAGTPVSYGHIWSAPADGWLATVQIGYADGVPRAVSNVGEVLVGGRRRQIAGRVCMDQLMVWCADHEPQIGDEVVLLGAQGDERILVEEWAAASNTITYEIVTQLTGRLPRHHRNGPSGASAPHRATDQT